MYKVILLLALTAAVQSYNEIPCEDEGGYCLVAEKCPEGDTVPGKCPTQPSSVQCCLKAPFNEPQCEAMGGTCTDQDCPDGHFVSRRCPSQPNDIKCCVPEVPAETCSGLGGTCINYLSCDDLVVSGLCSGGYSVRCCVPDPNVDDFDRHLSQTEGGIYLTGYIPTSGSGTTIATGVDLGQQSKTDLHNQLSDETLYYKLDPYIGLKTESAVHNAGLNEKDLKLTLPEARALDKVFKDAELEMIDPYDDNMTIKGRVVMVSLTHWCGNIVDHTCHAKCCHDSCPNYLYDTLIGKTATDQDLKKALINQKQCLINLGASSWKMARLDQEINYLD